VVGFNIRFANLPQIVLGIGGADIDTKLILLEDAIEGVHISVDLAIQHAIDVARGK
jgi:hypothetical protein